MTPRDQDILNHMIKYCDKINDYLNRCGNSKDQFLQDSMCQDACCMCVAQIGELSGLLSEELKSAYPEFPWRAIKNTRNFYIHNYGNVNLEYVWNTLIEDIPELKIACASIAISIDDAEIRREIFDSIEKIHD